ncbi:hypothetical protein Aperf_G00000097033 [Anoplocephala perfoliata]
MPNRSKASIPAVGTRVQKLRAALRADHNIFSSTGSIKTAATRSSGIDDSRSPNLSTSRYNLRSKRLLDKSPNLQIHFARVVSSSSHGSADRGTGAMKSITPSTPLKRRHIEAERESPSISLGFGDLGPVCSVPMIPSFNSQLRTDRSLRTTGTQTSPVQITATLDRVDGLNPCKRRRSKGRLVTSLKNKFSNLRRSLSSERLSVNRSGEHDSLIENMDEVGDEQSSVVEEEGSITSKLLEKCSADTFIVQFRRKCPIQRIGIFFSTDSIGLYISRLANERHIKAVKEYLRVNDRIISLQGVPYYHLDADAIRDIIRGCLVITIKVVRPSR